MTKLTMRRAKRLGALETAETSVPISFAIVGVQKAATTTFYQMLAQHPQIVNGPQKELRFFLEEQDWSAPDYSTYRRPLLSGGEIAGDATPAYLFWPHAMERMRDYNPDMRVMASFRDPIERAFSQWAMERSRHSAYPDLPDAIERYGADDLPERAREGRPGKTLQRSLFARGLYGAQLERALPLFPASQWLLFEFRDLLARYTDHLDRATDLLGLPRFEEHPELRHSMAMPGVNQGPAPTVGAVEGLVRRYADDLALFERLSGLDTSAWPTRQVIDGDLDVTAFHAKLCGKLGLDTSH
jgi:hypothetical protein